MFNVTFIHKYKIVLRLSIYVIIYSINKRKEVIFTWKSTFKKKTKFCFKFCSEYESSVYDYNYCNLKSEKHSNWLIRDYEGTKYSFDDKYAICI